MQNELLGNILNNIVMQKVVRDKIVMQQKQQRQQQQRLKREAEKDELDQFQDAQTRQIMRKMKEQRLRVQSQVPTAHRQQTRTVGQYRQIVETQFLNYVTKLKKTVVHFYHKDFQRCKIMDHHLKILCQKFPQTQFLYINAQKAPFFVEKLGIRTLPTLCIFLNGVLKDKQLGFQGLSGDQFVTWELSQRLKRSGVIDGGQKPKDKTILKGKIHKNSSDSEQN